MYKFLVSVRSRHYLIITVVSSPIVSDPHTSISQAKLRRRNSTVGNLSIVRRGIRGIASIVKVGQLQGVGLRSEECLKLTPSVGALAAGRKALAKGNGALVQDEVDVSGSVTCGVGVAGRRSAVGRHRLWGLDELNVETSTEWLHVRHDQAAVGLVGVVGDEAAELSKAESCENRSNVDIVAEVKVEALVEGESRCHVVKRNYNRCQCP